MKLKKSHQVILGLVLGLIIIAIISGPGEAKETDKPQQTKTEAEKPADKSSSSQGNAQALFTNTDDFKSAFNSTSKKNSLEFEIEEINVQEGQVNNTFQCTFTDNLGLVGTINKTNGSVNEITMIGKGDGTAKSGADLLSMMAVIIGTVDPSLPPAERGKILEDLGLFGDKKADLTDHSAKTDKNGIHYFITASDMMGIWFGAKRS